MPRSPRVHRNLAHGKLTVVMRLTRFMTKRRFSHLDCVVIGLALGHIYVVAEMLTEQRT